MGGQPWRANVKKLIGAAIVLIFLVALPAIANADSMTFTASGTNATGHPYDVEIDIVTASTTATITINNLVGTINHHDQAISSVVVDFGTAPTSSSLQSNATAAALVTCAAQNVACTYGAAPTGTTFGWFASNSGTTLRLCAGGAACNLQNDEIVGGAVLPQDQAIINMGPELEGPVTFNISLNGLSSAPSIGTPGFTLGSDATLIQTTPTGATPEPGSLCLLGSGLLGLAAILRRRRIEVN
jgi:hypothetical protein